MGSWSSGVGRGRVDVGGTMHRFEDMSVAQSPRPLASTHVLPLHENGCRKDPQERRLVVQNNLFEPYEDRDTREFK